MKGFVSWIGALRTEVRGCDPQAIDMIVVDVVKKGRLWTGISVQGLAKLQGSARWLILLLISDAAASNWLTAPG